MLVLKMPLHRSAKSCDTLRARASSRRSANVSDGTVSERNEVADRFIDSGFRINYYIANTVAARFDVVKDNRYLLPGEFIDQRGVDFRSHQQHSRNLPPYHAPDII